MSYVIFMEINWRIGMGNLFPPPFFLSVMKYIKYFDSLTATPNILRRVLFIKSGGHPLAVKTRHLSPSCCFSQGQMWRVKGTHISSRSYLFSLHMYAPSVHQ